MNAVRKEEEVIINQIRNPHSTVVLTQPDHMSDIKPIADHLLAGKSVIVNMEFAEQETRLRMLDFFRGIIFAISGSIERTSRYSVLLMPYGCEIQNQIDLPLDERDQSNYF